MTTTCGSVARRRWRVAAVAVALGALALVAPGPAAPPVGAQARAEGDAAWVAAAYDDLLDRAPSSAQVAHRVGQLEAGASRRSVADQLVGSREHAGVLVDRLYALILRRSADAGSRTYWIDRLQAGERDSTVASFLYGSPELYQRAGATAAGYVALLYRDVLGREPDPAGAAYWSARVAAGENRTGLARSWYLSDEATELRAGLVLLDLLRRPATASERDDWGARLRGVDVRRIEAAVVASTEYGRGTAEPRPPIRLTGGNGASTEPSISADGRVVAFVSAASDLTPAGSPPGPDVFVFDGGTGRLRAITAGNGASTEPEISADGTVVVFQSAATNLVAGDTNGRVDVFRARTSGGPIQRLTDGDGDSLDPSTSGDGTVVAYRSAATDLVAVDPNGPVLDVFVHTGSTPSTVERIGGADDASAPAVSADGGSVVFVVEDLDGPETGSGAFLARLPLGPAPAVVRLSEGAAIFTTTVSADGTRAAFAVLGQVGPRPASSLLVATIDGTEVTSRRTIAGPGLLFEPRISDDGSTLLFTTANLGFGSDRLRPTSGATPASDPTLPERSDLSADASIVVGALDGQLRLFEVA